MKSWLKNLCDGLCKFVRMHCSGTLVRAVICVTFALPAASLVNAAEGNFLDFLRKDKQEFEEWRDGKTKTSDNSVKEAQRENCYRVSNHPESKSVIYSGKAEYDGCSASLELNFNNNKVSGKMVKTGVVGENIRLTTTRISFSAVPLGGDWESEDTTISARWTGGDYIQGELLADYPTNGTVYIKLDVRNGENVILLKRVGLSSSYGYVFPCKGKVYSVNSGYHDPVGSWSGTLYLTLFNQSISSRIRAVFSENGVVKVWGYLKAASVNNSGKWKREGDGIKIIMNDDGDVDTALLKFVGRDCIVFRDGSATVELYRDSESVSGKSEPRAPRIPTVDHGRITGIVLSKTTMYVVAGHSYPLPEIYGIIQGTDIPVKLVGIQPDWTGFENVSVSNSQLVISEDATAGNTEGVLRVLVQIGETAHTAETEVKVVEVPPKAEPIKYRLGREIYEL